MYELTKLPPTIELHKKSQFLEQSQQQTRAHRQDQNKFCFPFLCSFDQERKAEAQLKKQTCAHPGRSGIFACKDSKRRELPYGFSTYDPALKV